MPDSSSIGGNFAPQFTKCCTTNALPDVCPNRTCSEIDRDSTGWEGPPAIGSNRITNGSTENWDRDTIYVISKLRYCPYARGLKIECITQSIAWRKPCGTFEPRVTWVHDNQNFWVSSRRDSSPLSGWLLAVNNVMPGLIQPGNFNDEMVRRTITTIYKM